MQDGRLSSSLPMCCFKAFRFFGIRDSGSFSPPSKIFVTMLFELLRITFFKGGFLAGVVRTREMWLEVLVDFRDC